MLPCHLSVITASPQCWHKCYHFPFKHSTKHDWGPAPEYSSFDFKWNHSSAICRLVQKHANFGLDVFSVLTWAFCGQFYCQPQTAAWQTHFATLQWHPDENLPSTLMCHCDNQTVLAKAEGGQRSAWRTLSWWMEINNSVCLGPLSLPSISLFLNAKCTWRGLCSQRLPVCNLASIRLNTQPRSSVKSDTAGASLHSVCNSAN